MKIYQTFSNLSPRSTQMFLFAKTKLSKKKYGFEMNDPDTVDALIEAKK